MRADNTEGMTSELAALRLQIDELEQSAALRGQVEDSLLRERNLSAALIQSSPVYFVIIGADGKTQMMNNTLLQALGYELDKVVGQDYLSTFVPQSDRASLSELFRALPETRKPSINESHLLTKDGRVLLVEWHGRTIREDSGAFKAFFGVGIDITEKRHVENSLQEREAQYRSIFESVTDAVLVFDLNGRIVEANPSACKMYGYAEQELIGKHAAEIVRADYFHGFDNFKRRVSDGGRFVADSINLCKDGTQFDIEMHGAGFTYRGAPHLLSVVRNISERKIAEEALRSTHRKIEQLHDIARRLEACDSEEEVYRTTISATEEVLSFSMCTLDIVVGERLVIKATSSELPPDASLECNLAEGGLAAETYRTKQSILFGSVEEAPESAAPTQPDYQSGISTPIGDFGVFQVASPEENAFGEEDVRLLELLLGHSAEAIHRIRLQEKLKEQALHDPLTGVYNRRYFNQVIEQEIPRSTRYNHPIGFLMIDIDDFKQINDCHGHQVGDQVLQEVAKMLQEHIRGSDVVVRYGGDEFLLLLIETNGEAEDVKRRILEGVALRNITNLAFDFPVTLSIGSAHWSPQDGRSVMEVLAEADRHMYEAKRH